MVAGAGDSHGDEEEVDRFWKQKEVSTNGFSNEPDIGVRKSRAEDADSPCLVPALPLTPECLSFPWPYLSSDSCTG